jgi:hypothetical protein
MVSALLAVRVVETIMAGDASYPSAAYRVKPEELLTCAAPTIAGGSKMPTTTEFLAPVLVLVAWTLVMWIWMYATRIPAMKEAGIDPQDAAYPGTWSHRLQRPGVRSVADNYNHLHEQPTIFYAVMFFAVLTGGADATGLALAWAYVALRIVHSLVQATFNRVLVRFSVFALASLTLMVITLREILRVLG